MVVAKVERITKFVTSRLEITKFTKLVRLMGNADIQIKAQKGTRPFITSHTAGSANHISGLFA